MFTKIRNGFQYFALLTGLITWNMRRSANKKSALR